LSVYFDTSFLVSLYAADTNSVVASRTFPRTGEEFWITPFTELEVVNALGLCVFRNVLSTSLAEGSLAAFEQDVRNGLFQVKSLPDTVFVRARQLSRQTTPRLGTRASDLLHVAAALELGADEFYTFDRQQAKLAKEMKLRVNATS
jgi:predicted nucleic acid-binding protein